MIYRRRVIKIMRIKGSLCPSMRKCCRKLRLGVMRLSHLIAMRAMGKGDMGRLWPGYLPISSMLTTVRRAR